MAYQAIIKEQVSASVWLIDMMMPGKNGAEIAAAIRKKNGSSPLIIAYTALDRQDLQKNEEYRVGLDHFNRIINKREDLPDLLSLVDLWINQA